MGMCDAGRWRGAPGGAGGDEGCGAAAGRLAAARAAAAAPAAERGRAAAAACTGGAEAAAAAVLAAAVPISAAVEAVAEQLREQLFFSAPALPMHPRPGTRPLLPLQPASPPPAALLLPQPTLRPTVVTPGATAELLPRPPGARAAELLPLQPPSPAAASPRCSSAGLSGPAPMHCPQLLLPAAGRAEGCCPCPSCPCPSCRAFCACRAARALSRALPPTLTPPCMLPAATAAAACRRPALKQSPPAAVRCSEVEAAAPAAEAAGGNEPGRALRLSHRSRSRCTCAQGTAFITGYLVLRACLPGLPDSTRLSTFV